MNGGDKMEIKEYKFYSKNAGKCCKGIFKSGRNFIRYYLFTLLRIISLPITLLHSFVMEGYFNQLSKISNNEKNLRIADSYKDMSNHKRLFNVLLGGIFSKIIKLAILFLIIFFVSILMLFAFSIDLMVSNDVIYLIALIPTGIAIIIYLLYLIFIYIPVEMILEEKDDLSYVFASKLSFTKMKLNESKNIIISYFLEYVVKVLAIALIVVLFIISTSSNLEFLALISTILLILYLFFIPNYSLKHQMIRFMVRRDIIVINDYNELSSINEKVFSTKIKNINDLFKKDEKVKNIIKQSSIVVENRTEIEESEKNDIKKLIEELTTENDIEHSIDNDVRQNEEVIDSNNKEESIAKENDLKEDKNIIENTIENETKIEEEE